MTIEKLIARLSEMDERSTVRFDFGMFACGYRSYRGDYSEMAIAYTDDAAAATLFTAGGLVNMLRNSIGAVHTGYKGGQYEMYGWTEVHAANWGETPGICIVGVQQSGTDVVLLTTHGGELWTPGMPIGGRL
jgi:hypothetical protein